MGYDKTDELAINTIRVLAVSHSLTLIRYPASTPTELKLDLPLHRPPPTAHHRADMRCFTTEAHHRNMINCSQFCRL